MSEKSSPSIENLTARLIAFRDARDWLQFHSLKNLIVSLNLEAAEVLELTQWQSDDDFEAGALTPPTQTQLTEECADVLIYLLLISERYGFDLCKAAAEKIAANELKYPVKKARGNAKKYTEL